MCPTCCCIYIPENRKILQIIQEHMNLRIISDDIVKSQSKGRIGTDNKSIDWSYKIGCLQIDWHKAVWF